jgi:hypothetical protein
MCEIGHGFFGFSSHFKEGLLETRLSLWVGVGSSCGFLPLLEPAPTFLKMLKCF